jgi:hypothetical protein
VGGGGMQQWQHTLLMSACLSPHVWSISIQRSSDAECYCDSLWLVNLLVTPSSAGSTVGAIAQL